MDKQKNSVIRIKYFFLLFSFLFIISCGIQKNYLTSIEAKKIAISANELQATEIENFIKPYRDNIDKDLNEVIAYNPETLDKKDGKWQTNIGNFIADINFKIGSKIFNKREDKSIDLCLLNNGGIRSILPKGDLTMKNAYQIMPFENSLYVIALKGAQIFEMATYIVEEKKPHPLSGMSFTISRNKLPINILIQGRPLEMDKTYFVLTNDYLMNGGDNMNFFKKAIFTYDLDYKLRNVLVDYLKEVDTVEVDKSIRIFEE